MFISVPMLLTGVAAHLVSTAVDLCIEKFIERSYEKVTGKDTGLSQVELAAIQAAVNDEYGARGPPVNLIPEHCSGCGAPLAERDITGQSIVCQYCGMENRLRFSSADDMRAWLETHAERKGVVQLSEEIEGRIVAELGTGVLGRRVGELGPSAQERLEATVKDVLADYGVSPESTGAVIEGYAKGTAQPRTPGVLDELGNLLVIGAAGAAGMADRIDAVYRTLDERNTGTAAELRELEAEAKGLTGKGAPQALIDVHEQRIGELKRFAGRLEQGVGELGALRDLPDLSDEDREAALRALGVILADAGAAAGAGISQERERLSRVISVVSTKRWAEGATTAEDAGAWKDTSSSKSTKDQFG